MQLAFEHMHGVGSFSVKLWFFYSFLMLKRLESTFNVNLEFIKRFRFHYHILVGAI